MEMRGIGLIALGTMGGAFARHLLAAGYAVSGYDIDRKRREALKRRDGRPAASIAEVSRDASRPFYAAALAQHRERDEMAAARRKAKNTRIAQKR